MIKLNLLIWDVNVKVVFVEFVYWIFNNKWCLVLICKIFVFVMLIKFIENSVCDLKLKYNWLVVSNCLLILERCFRWIVKGDKDISNISK